MSDSVRTRFAPSPTGRLHMGGARTALFCWAHARSKGGAFLVRVEDTDRERSAREHEDAILDGLAWLGLAADEPIVRQSERDAAYREAADRLLEQGDAYRCYATVGELDELRKKQIANGEKPMYDRRWRDRTDHPQGQDFVVRFATPIDGIVRVDDMIRGLVAVDNRELDDPVILRADGTPTYNFACAVDDVASGITDVIRGEDHLSNTLRQMHIVAALGGASMRYAHVPLIMAAATDEEGKPLHTSTGEPAYAKLSKRSSSSDMALYRREGFLPEAMVNYLAQLGWTNSENEVYGRDELAQRFAIERVHKSAARLDIDRLRWINRMHMRRIEPAQLAEMAEASAPAEAVALAAEHAHTLLELRDDLSYYAGVPQPNEAIARLLDEASRPALAELAGILAGLDDFAQPAIKDAIRQVCKGRKLKFPQLGMPLRAALTGREQTPDITAIAAMLGKDEVGSRLSAALD